MSDLIKLDYDQAEAMARQFRESADVLQETLHEILTIAAGLEAGALVGQSGDQLVSILRQDLGPSISRFTEKLRELEMDVQMAVAMMRQADSEAQSGFQ